VDIITVRIHNILNMSVKLANKALLDVFGPTDSAKPLKLAP